MTTGRELLESPTNATVMMIDDEPTSLEVVEVFLQTEGYRNLVKSSDSRQALELFAKTRPDALLLDLMMPHVNGLQILRAIRKHSAHRHTPVIILTSSTDAVTKIKALELGATDFLNKPVDPTELALRLRNVLMAKGHRDRLTSYKAQLERKVKERTAELNLMRIAAERASEAKSYFLANMSHEIRTPMTAIRGYAELLSEDASVSDSQRESLDVIKRNGDHLLAIINGVLDLSKIESGSMEVDRGPVDLAELVVEVARAMQVRASERDLALNVEFATPLPAQVISDAVRIRQGLVNLVGNAIKFTEEGSVTVRLGYDAPESMARVEVVDTGIGIPAELIPSMFLQFEQADASTSRQYGGTGLGLAITRRVAQLLGGDCTMESEVGRGSTVRLSFQAPLVDGTQIREVPEASKRLKAAPTETTRLPSLSARILVAEDGVDNQRLISMILRKAGAEVEIAENGREAVDRLRHDDAFDLVLMDMAMPEMDGYSATRTLREMGFELPIVALTAHALDGEREKCIAAGCDDYATKPIDKAALIRTVTNALEKPERASPPKSSPAPPPVVKAAPTAPAVADEEDETPTLTSLLSQPEFDDQRASTIMMVDDEPTTLDVIEAFLEGEGYSNFVRTCESRDAFDLVREHRPDILLLDLEMPHVGGLDVLGRLREDESLKHTPVLILTSSSDGDTRLKALELGASDFLSKPVDASELALRLRNTLAAKAYRDRLASYDALTGLPNRRLFLESLRRSLERVGRATKPCTVLHVGLNRFKQINDTLGHAAGDELVKAVADRLQNVVRDPLARVSSDEFAMLLPRIGSADSAARIAQRLLASIEDPFCIEGQDLFVTCSIGIAVFPEDGEDSDALLKNARAASSHAQGEGECPYQFYRESLNAESAERLLLESGLRGALYCDEMVLHYQPKVDVVTGRIIGAEALMRWKHPELGLMLPDSFIPLAEESDIIESLDRWALAEACRQGKAWLTAGYRPMPIWVNVSSRQFRTLSLTAMVRAALDESGLSPEHLALELTERQLMENPEKTLTTLGELREMGIRLAVNGFGTGHSSLSHLKRLPLDELKIDPSFVAGLPENAEDVVIVSAIIGLAHNLGLAVAAVGVETAAQLEFLKERRCEVYQGRLFGRPAPPREWDEIFEQDLSAPTDELGHIKA